MNKQQTIDEIIAFKENMMASKKDYFSTNSLFYHSFNPAFKSDFNHWTAINSLPEIKWGNHDPFDLENDNFVEYFRLDEYPDIENQIIATIGDAYWSGDFEFSPSDPTFYPIIKNNLMAKNEQYFQSWIDAIDDWQRTLNQD